MKVYLTIEGRHGAERFVSDDPSAEAWAALARKVEEYLSILKGNEAMGLQHEAWDMFHDELVARSLKPWTDNTKIESPSGRLWGWTSDEWY